MANNVITWQKSMDIVKFIQIDYLFNIYLI